MSTVDDLQILIVRALEAAFLIMKNPPGSDDGAQAVGTDEVPPDDPLLLLTADDVVRFFRVKKSWIYDAVSAGNLPAVKVGPQHLRFRRGDLERWLRRAGTAHEDV